MPASPPTLGDMIKAAVDSGQSYDQLAASSFDEQANVRASKTLLNNIVLNHVDRMPASRVLRAIAVGLRVPYEAVRRAAIAQWVPGDDDGLRQEVQQLSELTARLLDKVGEGDSE